MDPLIKEWPKMVYLMEKGEWLILMEIFIKENGPMEKQMVMEYLLIQMGLCIVDNGRMINSMAKELNHGTIIKLNLSASFKMVKKLEMENLNLLVVFTKVNLEIIIWKVKE